MSYIKNIIKLGVQYACVTHCIFEYVGDFVVCNGSSMEPTLYSNDILVTKRIVTHFNQPNRGDIIIAVSPLNPSQYICKRVVGLPGDAISKTPEDAKLINDSKLSDLEKSLLPFDIKFTDEFVPRGHIWIEGDNKGNSADSRYYGPIPLGLVRSRVICRIWPIDDIKIL